MHAFGFGMLLQPVNFAFTDFWLVLGESNSDDFGASLRCCVVHAALVRLADFHFCEPAQILVTFSARFPPLTTTETAVSVAR